MIQSKRLLTVSCYASLVSYAFTVAAWGPSVSLIEETFHTKELGVGLLRTAMFAGFTISVFLGGWTLRRIGPKRSSVIGPVAMGGAMVLFALSRNYYAAMCAMFAAGCAAGLLEAAVNTIISDTAGDRRAYAMNLLHIFFGVGAFIAPRVAGLLLNRGSEWRAVYLLIGGFAALAGLSFLPQRFPAISGGEALRAIDVARFARRPMALVLGVGVFFYIGTEIGINDWIVLYFETYMKADKLSASAMVANYWLFMTIGRFFCAAAARYVRAETLLLGMSALAAATAVMVFASRDPQTAGMCLALSGFFTSGIFATILAIGGDRFPRHVGTVTGILIGFSGLGNIIFPTAIGAAAQLANLRLAMGLTCSMLVFLVICAFIVARTPADQKSAA